MMVSSIDGYCSVIAFDDGEIGTVYEAPLAVVAATSAPVGDEPEAAEASPQESGPVQPLVTVTP
jgi:hypothetical protein